MLPAHSALAVVSWGVRYISVGAHPGIILFQQNMTWRTNNWLLLGASLAQDRGRLESRVEALTAEVSQLQKECQVQNKC